MVQLTVKGRVELLNRTEAQALLNDLSIALQRNSDGSRRPPEPTNIKLAVCLEFGLKPEEMDSDTRAEHINFPRQVAMWLVREITGLSLQECARHFPRRGHPRDHGTILYACRSVQDRMTTSPAILDRLMRLQKQITNSTP